ncbi:transglutaminase domain-containing protein [Kibdelosporangium persicum]|uniref:Transglutaminase domain-containing protein n=1 Tax=Kibdelosporangium persicum TaxID=2698649 RepID=A0ABX2EYI3_9PSEU|nr:transglutaminase domain-containing protein [Kibdelosporangium persicum]NRN64105.1 Transglutaminase domain-containing protein [Kibdelosporangium persicum]
MTAIRPQSPPAGPASAGGDVTHTVSVTRSALLSPDPPPKKTKRARQHIPQAQPRLKMGFPAYSQLVLAGAAIAVSSLLYLRYYSGLSFLISVLAATAAGMLIGTVAAVRRWPLLVTLGASVPGFLLVAIFAVFRGTLSRGIPTWTTLKSLGSSLISGWVKMLSVNLPADPSGELELTPALVCFAAAVVSAGLILRTKYLLAPILPPVLVFLFALPITAPRSAGGLVPVGVLLVLVLLLTLIRAGASDPMARTINARAAWGRFLFGVPVIIVAVAAGLAGMRFVPLADGDRRFDLREVVEPPLNVEDVINPLARVKTQLRKPDADVFTVRLTGDTEGVDRIRTVALDKFDGAMWTTQDQFLLAGSTLPEDESLVAPRRVTLDVRITGLPGQHLPEVGAPVSITGAPRVGFSRNSGTLATDQATTGWNYRLVAEVGRREGVQKSVPHVSDSGRYTELPRDDPRIPDVILAKGNELAAGVAEPYAKLMAIQKYMQSFPYNLDTRPGHSYDALSRLFGPNITEQVGYAEQFASAFAVLARTQGFPTRVAVGYLLDEDRRNGDTYQVKSGDAHAWPEVNLAGYGWVAFEPTDPQRRPATAPKPRDAETPADENRPEENASASQPAEDPNLPRLGEGGLTVLDWALYVLIGLGVLVVLTPVAVATEKFRRRRQRRSGSRAARVIGAWQQAADRLIEHGVAVTASSTVQEVSDQARDRIGEEGTGSLAVLAPLVTRAMFEPAEPDDEVVRQAWDLETQLRRELRKAHSPLSTVRAWLDPRPLYARWRDERRRRRALDKLTRG